MTKKNPKKDADYSFPEPENVAAYALALAKLNEEDIDELRTDLKKGLEALANALNNLKERNHLR
jgi:hypothetical protein